MSLVIEPNQATIYCFDGTTVQTTNNVAPHAPIPFADFAYVGWDPLAPTTRRFYGQIDEAMIFDRALSRAELTAIYSAGSVASIRIDAVRSGENLILTWPSGTLEKADAVTGPYTTNAVAGATSPYTNSVSGTKGFYRVTIP